MDSATPQRLYGRGGGEDDGTQLQLRPAAAVEPRVENKATYAPFYWSTCGYAVLAAVNVTTSRADARPGGGTNVMPARYALSTDGRSVTWTWPSAASNPHGIELYLMPTATSMDAAMAAYYQLIGRPAVPPRWALGFMLCRYGWSNRSYVEQTLRTWRAGRYPADAFIMDFGWFTTASDYAFTPRGQPDYHDFGYNNVTLPAPAAQLHTYRTELHFRFGGIRKPRLGNTQLLDEARELRLLLPGGTAGASPYAHHRNLNFSRRATRAWYNQKMAHYLADGVQFWWDDEGETDFFTFHEWGVAQADGLRANDPHRRFFSIARAFSPGLARVGSVVWTGDIEPTWEELRNTPGLVLNWALAGMPYVACDIGGFKAETNALLLTRWYQLGALMPIMRTHSTKTVTPHWPWLWGDTYAAAMRAALELRYMLLPYHYSCAHAMHTAFTLWMRPLLAAWPDDPHVAELTHEWLDGPFLLAAPIVHAAGNYSTYLPGDDDGGTLWFELNSSTVHKGPMTLRGEAAPLDAVPIYVRAPAIVPLAPPVQHTGELPGGPLDVHVYALTAAVTPPRDRHPVLEQPPPPHVARTGGGGVRFVLAEDDGETVDYQAPGGGHVRRTNFTWDPEASTLSWEVSGPEGPLPGSFEEMRVTLFRPGDAPVFAAPRRLGRGGKVVLSGL